MRERVRIEIEGLMSEEEEKEIREYLKKYLIRRIVIEREVEEK